MNTSEHSLYYINENMLPVKQDEALDCSNSISCRHSPVNTSTSPALLSYHISAIWTISLFIVVLIITSPQLVDLVACYC